MNEQRKRANEWSSVSGILIEEIRAAGTWHRVKCAADAIFHARLVFASYDKECARHEGQNDNAGAGSPGGALNGPTAEGGQT